MQRRSPYPCPVAPVVRVLTLPMALLGLLPALCLLALVTALHHLLLALLVLAHLVLWMAWRLLDTGERVMNRLETAVDAVARPLMAWRRKLAAFLSAWLLSACGTAPLPGMTCPPVPAELMQPPSPPVLLQPASGSTKSGPTTAPTPRPAPLTGPATGP